jgi:Flp pilus assembly protein TadG
MMRTLRKLSGDERGASIIEMALTAPFLAALVIGMVDISRGYNAKLQLNQAAQRAVEKAMQGMQGDESTDIFQGLQEEAALVAGVDEEDVDVRYWLECNGVSQNTSKATMAADYEKVCQPGEVYSRHLNVEIEKVYTPMFQTKWLGSNPDGTFDLIGEAGLRVQ